MTGSGPRRFFAPACPSQRSAPWAEPPSGGGTINEMLVPDDRETRNGKGDSPGSRKDYLLILRQRQGVGSGAELRERKHTCSGTKPALKNTRLSDLVRPNRAGCGYVGSIILNASIAASKGALVEHENVGENSYSGRCCKT
jgi:hypothetical protein